MAFAALLLILIGLRGRVIYDSARYVVADTPDLFSPAWESLASHIAPGSLLSVILAIAVTFLCTLIINNIVNRYGLTQTHGTFAGLFFIAFSGSFRLSLGFQPSMIFALSLIWGLDRLFSATSKTRPFASVAWGFGIVTLGCLFWVKGLCYLPLMFVLLSLLRIGGGRVFTAALLGLGAAVSVATTATLMTDHPMEIAEAYARSGLAMQPFWRLGAISITYLVIELGIILIATLSMHRHLLEMSITASRKVRVAEWVMMFSLLIIMLPGFSYEVQILIAIGASMLMPNLMYSIRDARLREVVPLAALGATAWLIYI